MAGFGNYPNMGHCVVENTVNSMRQMVNGFDEAKTMKSLNLNQYEQRAYRELYDLCEEVLRQMERLDEAEGEEEEFDEDEEFEEDF